MDTLLNLEDYTIAANDSTENHVTDRLDWQGWAIGDRFQIPRKIKKFSKLFGVWTVTDRWQSGKNAMLTISDGLRTLNQPVKELDLNWKIDDAPVVSPVLENLSPSANAEESTVETETPQAPWKATEAYIPISFGKTLDRLLSGQKSVTRRDWKPRHASRVGATFTRGLKTPAFDRDQRFGGKQVGWIKLTEKPYLERLADMPEADVIAEGFPELSKAEFIDRFFEGDADLTVWVIRFKFSPLQPLPSLVSESAEGAAVPEPISPAVEVSEPVAVEVVQADRPVIVGEACVERIDELSLEEERDRLHLERKVERAFYEAGKALRELRDRRLYRSTHKTFESYCRDRFGHSRQKSNFLIAAAGVYENLLTHAEELAELDELTTNRCQNESTGEMTTNGTQTQIREEMTTNGCQNLPIEEMTTNGAQILPTNERQIRPLTQLEPELQPLAWQEAIEDSGGKVPSGRVVKDVVDRFVRDSLPEPARAHHLTLVEGGLVQIYCPDSKKIHARLGRIAAVREKTVLVWLRDLDTMLMVEHSLKHSSVEAVPMEREPSCLAVAQRIDALRERSLDPFELEVLGLLERSVTLTPVELGYLEAIERQFGE